MSPVRRISLILRTLASPSALAAFLIIAEAGSITTHNLAYSMGHKSLDTARHLAKKLAAAGLIETRKTRDVSYSGHMFFYHVSKLVTIDADFIKIDAGGFPITIGRHLKEKE